MIRRSRDRLFLNKVAERFANVMMTKRWEFQVGPAVGPDEKPTPLTHDELMEEELKQKLKRGRVYNGQSSFPAAALTAAPHGRPSAAGSAKSTGPAAEFVGSYAATTSFPRRKPVPLTTSPPKQRSAAETVAEEDAEFDEARDIPAASPSSAPSSPSAGARHPSSRPQRQVVDETEDESEVRMATEAVQRMEAEMAAKTGRAATTTTAKAGAAGEAPDDEEPPSSLAGYFTNAFRGGFGRAFDRLNEKSVESVVMEWGRRGSAPVSAATATVVAVDHVRIEVTTGALGNEDEVDDLRNFVARNCPLTRFRQAQAVRVAAADSTQPLDVVDIVAVRQ